MLIRPSPAEVIDGTDILKANSKATLVFTYEAFDDNDTLNLVDSNIAVDAGDGTLTAGAMTRP